MKKWYPTAELVFTDTDSLLYEIKTHNVYNDIRMSAEMEDEFDFSAYPKGLDGHMLYSAKNKKSLGKMKDELNGMSLREFVGLRPKCYSLLFSGKVKDNVVKNRNLAEKRKGKGVKKAIIERYVRHEHYKKVHREMGQLVVRQNSIRSKNHSIGSYHQRKIGLTAYDTKRWICGCNVKTLAYGHYKIKQMSLPSPPTQPQIPELICEKN